MLEELAGPNPLYVVCAGSRIDPAPKIWTLHETNPEWVRTKSSEGNFALHIAARYGNAKACEALIDRRVGADVNAQGNRQVGLIIV